MSVQKITDAEWRVMHVVWKHRRISANDVIAEVVPETGWSPNTVRTLLIRLADKGVLHVEKERGREKEYINSVYTPLVSREECEAVHGRTFLERVFAGDTSRLLAHFVKDGDLTPEQI
ncbi:MAG: BlaI/MecI/CopY family transcriptional regulator, partial [Planctomycetaceae bacterium]|nr:BlaI/MecI/CopY family transcriptional regulator [Planctomycetaceae bacterium]